MGYRHFTQEERHELSILLKRGYSQRAIGKTLGKNHSSISRELRRNGMRRKESEGYDARKAHAKSKVKRSASKYIGMKVMTHSELRTFVEEKISKSLWTPEQVSGRWNREKHRDEDGNPLVISAPSIYKYCYSSHGQKLCAFLPSSRYHPKKRRGKKRKKAIIPNRVSIEDRPKSVEKRKEFGHCEGDTLGRIKGDEDAVTGVAERVSRRVFLRKMPSLKDTVEGFKSSLNPHHKILKSITLDNGVENVRHEELGMSAYFCNPYHPWEKGTIENSFQRLRRFIPKKSSLRNFSSEDIARFENIMNETPRKCLRYRTPNEVFSEYSG